MYFAPAWMLGSTMRDVAHLQSLARGRHDLHDPDGALGTPRVLVELGLLVALRGKHERVEVVLLPVLLKKNERLLEALPLRRARWDS